MAEKVYRQETGPESHEGILGDGIPRNGVDDQAARRAHMREQTMARQAAERTAQGSPHEKRRDRSARLEREQEREAGLQEALTRINTDHQTWLRKDAPADLPESEQEPSKSTYSPAPEAPTERTAPTSRLPGDRTDAPKQPENVDLEAGELRA